MEYVKVLNLNNLIEACFNVYQEIGYQIGEPRTILSRKTISHLECINVLLAEQFPHEILIILRSALESTLLFCYLTVYPEKQAEYISDCQLIELKNTFISLKNFKKDMEIGAGYEVEWDRLTAEFKKGFKQNLSKENQDYLIKKSKINECKLTNDNFDKIDKFFKTDKRIRKPFFMDMEKMYSELPPLKEIKAEYRDLVFSDYNLNSQVTHGHYFRWTSGLYTDDKFLNNVKWQLTKIVMYPLLYLKGQVQISQEYIRKLKQATDPLVIR